MDARPPVFRTEGLSIGYETDSGLLPAVRDATMEIAARECFGLVGESGSGKTTLAMGAIGYLGANGRVISGSARLGDIELTGLSRARMRSIWGRRIGMVYQNPSTALNPSLRIGRQLSEVAQAHLGLSRADARRTAVEMLTRVAMPDPEAVLGRYPHQLSGGMLQRCVIAMALSTGPEMLILDEPTTALDVTTQAVVLDLVKRLKSQLDSSILYITHDLAVVCKLCDRVGVMYAGQFCEQAPMRELYKRPLHPYTLGLLGCVPRFDPSGAKRLLASIPGLIPRPDELPKGCIFAPRCVFARAGVHARAAAHGGGDAGALHLLPSMEGPPVRRGLRAGGAGDPAARRAARGGAAGAGSEEDVCLGGDAVPTRKHAPRTAREYRARRRRGDPLGQTGQHPRRGRGKRVRKDHDAARHRGAGAPDLR